MVKVAILIPVLRRPQNIKPLVRSIEKTTKNYELFFVASPGDEKEIFELENQNQCYKIMNKSFENNGDYARKINFGYNSIKAEWYFIGADDLQFHSNWFEMAMKIHEKVGACVIGTNDLGNPSVLRGQHATHSLVLGEYVRDCGTIDEPGKVLHEGYKHNFVDTEFVATAKCREAWAFARDSRIEHCHPDWKKGVMDEVYQIGKNSFKTDEQYFAKRRELWM